MSSKKSKTLPIAAGLFVLFLLAGFSLGLRTVMEFDPQSAQMRTSKYLFYKIPITVQKQELWFSDGTAPTSPVDWQLMHEFHHSATGSKIDHTHWGSIADTIILWDELELEPETKAKLADRANELIHSDRDVKSIRATLFIINSVLGYTLEALLEIDEQLPAQDIDLIFDKALATPTDAQESMLPDP